MGLGSGIRKKPIPDPGSRGQNGTGSRTGSATLILSNAANSMQDLPAGLAENSADEKNRPFG